MNKSNIIKSLVKWGNIIVSVGKPEIQQIIQKTSAENPWFTESNISFAISSVLKFLDKKKLNHWLTGFDLPVKTQKSVGLVLAGNIPLVGFHDILCVLVAGHHAQVKLSSQDKVLIPYFFEKIGQIDPDMNKRIEFVEILSKPDAVIATGSDNSARYFEYYFQNIPHIIRKNRISVGVLNGKESIDSLQKLGNDIFQYFGLGCRNISKLYFPENFDFNGFFSSLEPFRQVIHQSKYNNNYDYNKSIYLVNRQDFKDNGFLLLKPDQQLVSPISVVYYEFYKDETQLLLMLENKADKIQVIGSDKGWVRNSIGFGEAQMPELWDYADDINTLEFLKGI